MKVSGDVRCGKIEHFRSKADNKKHPVIPNYSNINVTSGTNSKWKALSPMKLGPFYLREHTVVTPWYPDGLHPGFALDNEGLQRLYCTNLENIWQGSKVYDIDLDSNRLIGRSFYERRMKMAHDPKPHRRAIPKAKGTPVCAYWDGHILPYLESRLVYCELYSDLVMNTNEYQELVNKRNSGENLHIVGYDGRDLSSEYEDMRRACLDPTLPFGHELVLCCMLVGISPWRDIWLNKT